MPLGFERLNERTQRPNTLINFIKPLPGPYSELASDFLSRVAAISYPMMRAHHISVMSLEEYTPNPEFVGRNFNAGEVIQLVLKAPHTGQWLPFRHVQMVMMHELAHCKQMNHSRDFWKVRNAYAEHLQELWSRNYSGEGLWGRGQTLLSGRYMTDRMPEAAGGVRDLCGGVYRGRGRKRKRGAVGSEKPKVSYAERQQRRIAKKFGVHGGGVALGDDVLVKSQLEKGRQAYGKPKVAGSKRGRELRAAAALARFEQPKLAAEDELRTESETESDYGDDLDFESLVNDQGEQVVDIKGNGLVKVCGDEDPEDDNARREMEELRLIDHGPKPCDVVNVGKPTAKKTLAAKGKAMRSAQIDNVEDSTASESEDEGFEAPRRRAIDITTKASSTSEPNQTVDIDSSTASEDEAELLKGNPPLTRPAINIVPQRSGAGSTQGQRDPSTGQAQLRPTAPDADSGPQTDICPICSLANEARAATCMACAHVLDKTKIPRSWQCQSSQCQGASYINAGDCGRCGICGSLKSGVDA